LTEILLLLTVDERLEMFWMRESAVINKKV
jgi:hypothetical protein